MAAAAASLFFTEKRLLFVACATNGTDGSEGLGFAHYDRRARNGNPGDMEARATETTCHQEESDGLLGNRHGRV